LLHRHLTPPCVEIERLPVAVTRDEQTIVLPIDTAPLGDTATLPRPPRQAA
jgi:hypothetical protein